LVQRGRIVTARILAFTLAICVSSSRLAGAQTVPPSADAPPAVRVGQTVWVTTADGREVQGKIGSLSATEIGIRSGGYVTPIRWTTVRLIEEPDSNVDGSAWGALIGALAGGVPAALYMANDAECPCPLRKTKEIVTGFSLVGAGIGTAVGLAVDSLRRGRRPLYRASATVSLAPVVRPARLGIAAVVRW
jgi:hypothetical protein